MWLLRKIANFLIKMSSPNLIFENDHVKWTIGKDGSQKSFLIKPNNEIGVKDTIFPVCCLVTNDNNSHPASRISVPIFQALIDVVMKRDFHRIVIKFLDVGSITLIFTIKSDRFYIELSHMNLKQGYTANRLTFFQTLFKTTLHAEVIGGYWPVLHLDNYHIAYAALSPYVDTGYVILHEATDNVCSSYPKPHVQNAIVFKADAVATTGFDDIRLAIITAPRTEMLDGIKRLYSDTSLPCLKLGREWFRTSEELIKPYLFTDLTQKNVKDVINIANEGGVEYVLVWVSTWAYSQGKYAVNDKRPEGNPSYPDGEDGLIEVARLLHQNGLKFGIHVMSARISKGDHYVKEEADRLATFIEFKLAAPIPLDTEEGGRIKDAIEVEFIPKAFENKTPYDTHNHLLTIENEIIRYSYYEPGTPGKFIIAERGCYGTAIVEHSASRSRFIRHLIQTTSGHYLPDPNGTLLSDIAKNIFHICEITDADMIYFDAAEAMNKFYRRWYDDGWINREVFFHLKRSNKIRSILFTGNAEGSGHSWHFHMRGAVDDGVNITTKYYLDLHKVPLVKIYQRNFVAAEMGWLNIRKSTLSYPATQPDEWEYFCCKALAYNVPISLYMPLNEYNGNGRANECLKIIQRYQYAQQDANFSEDTIESLKECIELNKDNQLVPSFPKEFELVDSPEWGFRRIRYGPTHLVKPNIPETESWTVDNSYEPQPLSLRIRARNAVHSYEHDTNVELFVPDFEHPADWIIPPDNEQIQGARCSVELTDDVKFEGGPFLRFTGHNTESHAQSRAYVKLELEPHMNLTNHRSIGLWVYGDGGGQLLDVQLVDQSGEYFRDYLIRIDSEFIGGKIERIDADTVDAFRYHLCPAKGNLRSFDFEQVSELRLQFMDMPPVPVEEEEEGEEEEAAGEQVSVYVGKVLALTEVEEPLVNPTIVVNGNALVLPVKLECDEMLELQPNGVCKIFDRDNVRRETIHLAMDNLPEVMSGVNQFSLTQSGSTSYAYVTPILRGSEILC